MRVVFTGCSGSGKTTLVNGLIDKMTKGELPFQLPSVLSSRTQTIYSHYGIAREIDSLQLDLQKVKAAQFELFEDRMYWEDYYDNFVSDRGIVDIYIYTLIKCNAVLSETEIKWLHTKTFEYMSRCTHIFYCYPVIDFTKSNVDSYRMYSYGQEYVYQILHNQFLTCNFTANTIHYLGNVSKTHRLDAVISLLKETYAYAI